MGLIRHRSLPSNIDQLDQNPLAAAEALKEAPKHAAAPQPLSLHNIKAGHGVIRGGHIYIIQKVLRSSYLGHLCHEPLAEHIE